MRRIAIIVGHSQRGTYCEALGEAYAKGARLSGHEPQVFVTSKMAFDPILREGFARPQPLEPDLQAAHDAIVAAEHVVILFPLWLNMVPAILKGFLERVFQPECIEPSKAGKFPKFFKGKSVRIVITMGMPVFFYRIWCGSYALKSLRRFIFSPLGATHIESTLIGRVEAIGDKGCQRWLRRFESLGRRAA